MNWWPIQGWTCLHPSCTLPVTPERDKVVKKTRHLSHVGACSKAPWQCITSHSAGPLSNLLICNWDSKPESFWLPVQFPMSLANSTTTYYGAHYLQLLLILNLLHSVRQVKCWVEWIRKSSWPLRQKRFYDLFHFSQFLPRLLSQVVNVRVKKRKESRQLSNIHPPSPFISPDDWSQQWQMMKISVFHACSVFEYERIHMCCVAMGSEWIPSPCAVSDVILLKDYHYPCRYLL